MQSQDFYITLLSDTECAYHTNNTSSDFTNQLYKRYNLENHWEVALCDIIYPTTSMNIEAYKIIAWVRLGRNIIRRALFDKTFFCEDINVFLRQIQKKLENDYIFTLRNSSVVCTPKNPNFEIKFSQGLAFQLGIRYTTEFMKGEIIAELVPDMNANVPKQAFVCTNIVKPSCFGDRSLQLLRTIPLKLPTNNKGRTSQHLQFENLLYVPLCATDLEKISINIRDRAGNNLSLDRGTCTVLLHFRKKPEW